MFGKVENAIFISQSMAYLDLSDLADSTKVASLACTAAVKAGELPSSTALRRARL
jgi:hypothetical protein